MRVQAQMQSGVPYYRELGVEHDVINATDFETINATIHATVANTIPSTNTTAKSSAEYSTIYASKFTTIFPTNMHPFITANHDSIYAAK